MDIYISIYIYVYIDKQIIFYRKLKGKRDLEVLFIMPMTDERLLFNIQKALAN